MVLLVFKNFIKRTFVYQIVFLWIILRLNNIEKTSGEYKDKFTRNFRYFQIDTTDFNEFIEDPSIFVLFICLFELISSLFGLFGSFYGNLFATLLFGITNLIYFNPLLPENRIKLYGSRQEILYNLGIFISMLMMTFYSDETKKKVINAVEDPDEENEKDEKLTESKIAQTQNKKSKKIKKK